ncbi:MAG: hypothetical protein HQ582_33965, partial [Planctomycetes bacterium]|nr:hypothetical protein [Planctomycetota bacterium]
CTYDHAGMGFPTRSADEERPTVDEHMLCDELYRRVGLGREFIARVTHSFMFQALDVEAIRHVLTRQLERLSQTAELHGHRLAWDADLIEHLTTQWQPRFGVRYLTTMLRNRIHEQLSVAETQGELEGVSLIHLVKLALPKGADLATLTGTVSRERKGDTLIIHVT